MSETPVRFGAPGFCVFGRGRFSVKSSEQSPRFAEVRSWLLDALVDAPSSFAASLVFIRQMWGEQAQRLSVDEQLDVVHAAARDGLIELRLTDESGELSRVSKAQWSESAAKYQAWLANLDEITAKEVAYDHVGLWMQLTESGREHWARLHPEAAAAPRWRADYDAQSGRVVALAESLELARHAAREIARNSPFDLDVSSESISMKTAGVVEVSYKTNSHRQT